MQMEKNLRVGKILKNTDDLCRFVVEGKDAHSITGSLLMINTDTDYSALARPGAPGIQCPPLRMESAGI